MRPTRREMLAVAASSIALAGCSGEGEGADTTEPDAGGDGGDGGDGGGDSDGTGDEDGDGTETPTGTADDGTSDGETVQVSSHSDLGDILVDSEGMTLYMFDPDEQGAGESTCYDGCADNWPPLTVEEEPTTGDGVDAELTTFEREDGSTQVAANGWPLYYFASDEEPGDVAGQAVSDVWWVLDPSGEPQRGGEGTPTATEGDSEETPTTTEGGGPLY